MSDEQPIGYLWPAAPDWPQSWTRMAPKPRVTRDELLPVYSCANCGALHLGQHHHFGMDNK